MEDDCIRVANVWIFSQHSWVCVCCVCVFDEKFKWVHHSVLAYFQCPHPIDGLLHGQAAVHQSAITRRASQARLLLSQAPG